MYVNGHFLANTTLHCHYFTWACFSGSPAGIQASHSPRQDYGSPPYSSEHDSCDGGSDDDIVESGSRSSSSSSSDSSRSAADPGMFHSVQVYQRATDIWVHSLSSQFASAVIIPKAAEIEAARRQRRANRAPKQFIPLGRDGHSSAGSTPGRYSRDEEDDDDELDDHEKIIEFAPRPKSIRERIAQILGMNGWGKEDRQKLNVLRTLSKINIFNHYCTSTTLSWAWLRCSAQLWKHKVYCLCVI